MKRTLTIVLTAILIITLTACGKSSAAKNVEEAIASLGEVTEENLYDYKATLESTEQKYDMLSDKEKESIENRFDLISARERFDSFVATLNAQVEAFGPVLAQFNEDFNVDAAIEQLLAIAGDSPYLQAEAQTCIDTIEACCYPGTHFVRFDIVSKSYDSTTGSIEILTGKGTEKTTVVVTTEQDSSDRYEFSCRFSKHNTSVAGTLNACGCEYNSYLLYSECFTGGDASTIKFSIRDTSEDHTPRVDSLGNKMYYCFTYDKDYSVTYDFLLVYAK